MRVWLRVGLWVGVGRLMLARISPRNKSLKTHQKTSNLPKIYQNMSKSTKIYHGNCLLGARVGYRFSEIAEVSQKMLLT